MSIVWAILSKVKFLVGGWWFLTEFMSILVLDGIRIKIKTGLRQLFIQNPCRRFWRARKAGREAVSFGLNPFSKRVNTFKPKYIQLLHEMVV